MRIFTNLHFFENIIAQQFHFVNIFTEISFEIVFTARNSLRRRAISSKCRLTFPYGYDIIFYYKYYFQESISGYE